MPPCKVFRAHTCASAFDRAPGISPVFRRQALCYSLLGLSLISLVLLSARSFADKPCVAHSHSRMRAVAVDFAATAACPFGPSGPSGPSCKVFRDQTCASAFDHAPGIRLGLFAGAYRQPLHPGARWHREAE